VDIVEESFTIDPSRVEDTLRKDMKRRIRAIIVVHIYGHPADMSALTEIGRRYDIPVIEDCAQAHGAKIGDLRVGSFGACGAFSFYPTKNLGAFGDGGAIVTNDTNLAERIQLLRQYGWRERYISSEAGYNSRLDELQAALLDCKLNWLDADNERRRLIARRYTEGLAGLPLKTPVELPGTYHVYHQYTIRLSDRNGLRKHLEAQGVGTSVLYPVPVHLQPCYRERVEIGCGGMAFTEKSAGEILCLPIYPELHDAEVNLVISEIQSFFRG
jgi:dTDP-4-amino-4,6-dideoxygalactose transaminase